MYRDNLKKFSLLFILVLCSNIYASDEKSYLEDLEEAFVAKIQQNRKHKKDADSQLEKVYVHQMGKIDTTEENGIGKDAASAIKDSFKEAKGFFALGEWSSWEKTQARFEKAEKALNNFKSKYSSQLAASYIKKGAQPLAVLPGVVTEKEKNDEDEEDEDESPVKTPLAPTVAPQSSGATMPGMISKPATPVMPAAPISNNAPSSVSSMPGMVSKPMMPAVPAAPAAPAMTMPGMVAKPAVPAVSTMPGIKPAAPSAPGMGMTAPVKGPGGMPLA